MICMIGVPAKHKTRDLLQVCIIHHIIDIQFHGKNISKYYFYYSSLHHVIQNWKWWDLSNTKMFPTNIWFYYDFVAKKRLMNFIKLLMELFTIILNQKFVHWFIFPKWKVIKNLSIIHCPIILNCQFVAFALNVSVVSLQTYNFLNLYRINKPRYSEQVCQTLFVHYIE